MSFDIYFLAPDRPFSESLDAIEMAATSGVELALDDADSACWDRITVAPVDLWPNAEHASRPGYREMSDLERGAQLAMSPGELSLAVAYWHTGGEAEAIDAWLREVVTAIEQASSLVGYDPQSDARFLDGDRGDAAETMNHVATRMREVMAPQKESGLRRFFNRLFRRP